MRILGIVAGRVAHFLMVVWLVVTLMFLMLLVIKGNPISLFLDTRLSPEVRQNLEQIHGYDRNVLEQYGLYLYNLCRGELGISFIHKEPVRDVLATRIGKSIWLGGVSYVLGSIWCFIILAGINLSKSYWAKKFWDLFRQICLSVPSFLFGTLLMSVFGHKLGWFPIFGSRNLFSSPSSGWGSFLELLHHSVLPAMSLALSMAGQMASHLQEQVRDLRSAPFVMSARGRGISERRIFFNHIMRTLMPDFIQLAGLYMPMIAVGALVIEAMFGWAGMGLVMMDAVLARDYPLLLGSCIWTSFFVIPGYEIADFLRRRMARTRRGEV